VSLHVDAKGSCASLHRRRRCLPPPPALQPTGRVCGEGWDSNPASSYMIQQ
jgi:hypothetical protein